MKRKIRTFLTVTALVATSFTASAASKARPIKPTPDSSLVKGATFIERFLPLPSGEISDKCWGAKNVIPRNIENGLEDADHSYWGGNILKGDDGKYHLIGARWPQDISRPNGKSGHELWWDSDVYHAVSYNLTGPYKVLSIIGKGHNPEVYRLKDGRYVIGVMGLKAYIAPSINGPWSQIETKLDVLGEGRNKTNRTYIVREDGSVYMMNKEGVGFESVGSDVEHFRELNVARAYFRANGSHEEDPVIWKDEVEYNLVVNDCLGRIGYYLTSKDGKEWKYEDGYSYTPDIVYNSNGIKESWWKLERPKVYTDDYGRPLAMNFAAVDTLKHEDKANDNHSSKNLIVPLRVERLMSLESPKVVRPSTKKIAIKLLNEADFNAAKEVDTKSLRLGSSYNVNRGNGMKATKVKKAKDGVIITFEGSDSGFKEGDYKLKLLGKLKNGEPISAKARVDGSKIN